MAEPTEPPCTKSLPPTDVKPWYTLAGGGGALSAAMSSVQVKVEGSNECKSARSPANGGAAVTIIFFSIQMVTEI
jgi:hypothetical protein